MMQNQCHTPYYSIDGILSAMSTHTGPRNDGTQVIPHPSTYWHTGHHYGEYLFKYLLVLFGTINYIVAICLFT